MVLAGTVRIFLLTAAWKKQICTPSIELVLTRTDTGNTLLHEAAENGAVDRFPPRFITFSTLTSTNSSGETALHTAAFNGHLDQIPREHLTAGTLLLKTNHDTCLHATAISGHLDQIPLNCSPMTISFSPVNPDIP
jgi:ankyrin repeat protein